MKFLILFLLEIFWKLWTWTIRLQVQGLDLIDRELAEGRIPVFAVPHHTILLTTLAYGRRPATLLASLSKDGELAAKFLKRRGFRLVRGSSSKGGKEALASLQNALSLGQPVAITFDGPRGPRLVPKPGIAVCAWHATGGLYFVGAEIMPSRLKKSGLCVQLNSWDRFVVPLPFCRLTVNFQKLELPEKKDHPLEEWVNQTLAIVRSEAEIFYRVQAPASVSETSRA